MLAVIPWPSSGPAAAFTASAQRAVALPSRWHALTPLPARPSSATQRLDFTYVGCGAPMRVLVCGRDRIARDQITNHRNAVLLGVAAP